MCTTVLPGNVLLISLITLSAMMLSFAIFGTTLTMERMQGGTASELGTLAKMSAAGCMDHALEQIGLDHVYAGNQSMTINEVPCTIRPIRTISGKWIIESQASINFQTFRYKVILSNLEPITVDSWTEVASF